MNAMNTANSIASRSCDNTFGPSAAHCDDPRFDFTLYFEQSILTIVPYAICIAATLPRLVRLYRNPRKVGGRLQAMLKLGTFVSFTCLQLALLILWASHQSPRISIVASALGLINSVILCVLSYMEHYRSIRPSTIISIYLFLSIIFDATQCRTLWLLNDTGAIAPLFTVMLATKVTLFILEIQGKQKLLYTKWKSMSAEATSGIVGRGVFWWLNSLLMRGFKASLSMATLDVIDEQLSSKRLLDKMCASGAKKRSGVFHKYRLFLSVCETIKGTLLKAIPGRLCLIGFKFAQPLLLNRAVKYIQTRKKDDPDDQNTGYALIGAVALVYLGYALSNGFYDHQVYKSMTMIRGAVVSLICARSLDQRHVQTGDPATLTLTGPDVDVIAHAFRAIHELWACPIEIALAVYLLERQLGAGCVGPVISVIVCTFLASRLPKYMGPAIKAWNEAIQTRVNITSAVLGSIREVKMIGAIRPWMQKVQNLRGSEMNRSSKSRVYMALMNVVANLPTATSPILMFGIALAVFRSQGEKLTVASAFTALSVTSMISGPLSQLSFSVPTFVSSFAIFERIETFVEGKKGTKESNVSGRDIELQVLQESSSSLVEARDASFSVKPDEDARLHNVTLSIKKQSLNIITGKIGSGKTLLLHALLGELHRVNGEFTASSSTLAFCPQTTWLMTGSIKENIIGFDMGDFDETYYNTVIRACALDSDFDQMPRGDDTLVGSKGMTLSGGQKHRISLARALYSRKKLVIADDILSSLDIATQKHVWTNVFGSEGLFQRNQSAVIIATHSLNYLRQADQVIVMDECKVAYSGPFANLPKSIPLPDQLEIQLDSNTPKTQDESETKQQKRLQDAGAIVSDREEQDLMQSGDTKLYTYYFRSFGWKYGVIFVATKLSFAFTTLFSQIWLKWWTAANDNNEQVDLGRYFGVYCLLLSMIIVTFGVDVYCMFVRIIPVSSERLHWTLVRTTMRAPLSFFASTQAGDLINRFAQDMSLIDRDLPSAVYVTSLDVLECVSDLILVVIGVKYLGAGIPIAFAFLYVLQKFYLRTSRQLRLLDLQAKAPLYTHLLETADGLVSLRAYGWQEPATKRSIELLDTSQQPHYLLFAIQRWLNFVLDVFVAVMSVLLITLAVTTDISSPSNLALAMYSVIGLSSHLAELIEYWTVLETSLGAITRLRDFEQNTPYENDDNAVPDPQASWPERGHLQLKNIKVSYAHSSSELHSVPESDLVLKGINIGVGPGEKVAICGRTGSGKSTLLSTLFRLVDYGGCVELDNVDISTLQHETVRSRLITVPQEPVLLPDTVRENLSSDKSHSDHELQAVLEKVDLWDVVDQKGGLDTQISELSLSHGQKQLICLARAMLCKDRSRLLILDEAMSSVDHETERLMVRLIEDEFSQHTVLSVVHRLATVSNFDRVIVLDQGQVVATGTPAEMISRVPN